MMTHARDRSGSRRSVSRPAAGYPGTRGSPVGTTAASSSQPRGRNGRSIDVCSPSEPPASALAPCVPYSSAPPSL
eukprot:48016-Eustigmatos_ZCMA.PRE.1